MKVSVTEMLDFLPGIIFAVLTDIPYYVAWAVGPVELVSLTDNPARLGTRWEYKSDVLGRRLVISNECNVYEKNRTFGWITRKPISSQVTLTLEPEGKTTKFTWSVESGGTGIAQLAEPLLVKQTNEMIYKSLIGLKAYLQAQS